MRMSNEPPETHAGPTVCFFFILTKYEFHHNVISTVFLQLHENVNNYFSLYHPVAHDYILT